MSYKRLGWGMAVLAVIVLAVPALAQQVPPQEGPAIIWDRLQPDRLAAMHADIVRYAAARKTLPPQPGLLDLKAVIHSHSWLSHDSWGKLPDYLAACKAAGVKVVMMSDHPSDKHDYYKDGLRGLHEGVLFIPGAETRGFVLYPRAPLDTKGPATSQDVVDAVLKTGGVLFVSHPEGHGGKPFGLKGATGMELYNYHYDRVNNAEMRDLEEAWTERDVASKEAVAKMLTLLAAARKYPEEAYLVTADPLPDYLAWYDRETQLGRFTAVSANDAHAHWGIVIKGGPGGTVVTEGTLGNPMAKVDPKELGDLLPATWKEGDVLLDFLLDTYEASFKYTSTHLLAPAQTEDAVFDALRAGHCYVAFDWLADPSGFCFQVTGADKPAIMGDEVKLAPGLLLQARLPLPAKVKLVRDGVQVPVQGFSLSGLRDTFEYPLKEAGVYRLEAWLSVGGRDMPWIYSNPIYVRP